ncbi:carbohydrate porin [Alteromonas sp. ASW11-130]|uniref:carbohydrate porin n=1 Tax=Alteromonas sp. ASW11-130 TaxID=3015775 RepID=UPI002242BF08|nr:carbohydrate porin [Alteromonas sp. ASW11-130]MCW8091648.1 carbohydrate porin [Alteromonas sp. ASW11-130]
MNNWFCNRTPRSFYAVLLILYAAMCAKGGHAQVTHEVSANAIIDLSALDVEGVDKDIVTRGLVEAGYQVSVQQMTGYLSVVMLRGENASDYVGDIQAFSNIDEDEFEGIYEAWGQYEFTDTNGIKAGFVDLNNDFAFAQNALEFMNGSMGLSPTVFTLPTYPDPAASLVVNVGVFPNHTLRVAAAAGSGRNSFSDRFYIGEWHYQTDNLSIKIGGWEHDGEFLKLTDNSPNQGANGAYAVLEGPIAQSDWYYYLQLGASDAIVAEIDRHLGLGVISRNAFDNDTLMFGAAYTIVRLSNYLPVTHSAEKAFEVFVKSQVATWLAIKPNLQYIANPAGENRNELVATLRFELSY